MTSKSPDYFYEGDVIQITQDLDQDEIKEGAFGTVRKELSPYIFEVEFVNDDPYSTVSIPLRSHMLRLHERPS